MGWLSHFPALENALLATRSSASIAQIHMHKKNRRQKSEHGPQGDRITESSRLEDAFKIKSSCQPSATIIISKHIPKCLLNTSREDDSATSLGNLFQCLTTQKKIFFLISSMNLPWHNLTLFLLILWLETWQKRLTPT